MTAKRVGSVNRANQKACRVRVEGRVQRTGYRRFVADTAQELGISGYARNEDDGSVTVFAQGSEPLLSKFLEMIRTPPEPSNVKSFTRRAASVNPKVRHFRIKFGSVAEELHEGFGSMEKEFRDYRGEFRGFKEEFRDYRQEFRDYRGEFRDYRKEFRGFASRTDENFKTLEEMYGETSAKLTQVLETLERESMETRRELTRAVDTLSELVAQFVGKKA